MFVERLLSGIVLLVVIGSCFFLGGFALVAMLAFCAILGYNELCKAMKLDLAHRIPGFVVAAFMYAGMYFYTDYLVIAVALLVFTLITLTNYVVKYPNISLDVVKTQFFAFLYAPFLFTFIYFTRESEWGLYFIWLILLSSWVCDIFAYCVGMLIGKKKIFPVLSPKKSLEGCIGGVVASGIAAYIYGAIVLAPLFPNGTLVTIITTIGCMLCAIFSMIGDLAASGVKRHTEIKDYSKLIPGHGGIMDRFDSMLFVAPICFIITKIIELV